MNQQKTTYTTKLPAAELERNKQSLLDDVRAFLLEKYAAQINGETVPCNIVDIDRPDNRVYVETFPGSEVRCLPLDAVQPVVEV